MVKILTPAGPWTQAGNACFFSSGMVADLLLVRIFLFLAYVWLLTAALTGYPIWPNYEATGSMSIDGIVWSVLNLIVHGAAVFRLLYDERRIHFKSEDENQMYRFFYRRCGMERLEFREILKYGKFRHIKAGDVIVDELETFDTLVFMVEGKAMVRKELDGEKSKEIPILSGMSFDISLYNVFGVHIGFERDPRLSLSATAVTDCLVYEWTIDDLNTIASGLAPAVSSYFRNFILNQIATEWEFRMQNINMPVRCSRGYPESEEHLHGARSCDFTDPFAEGEDPQPTVRSVSIWLWRSLSPFMPPGMRHNSLPVHGNAARMRIMALKQAQQQKAQMSLRRLNIPPEDAPGAQADVANI